MKPGERAQQRRLPAPVRSDQRGDATAAQLDVDAVDHDDAAIGDVNVAGLQLDLIGHGVRVP
jgi:hypothetical protein